MKKFLLIALAVITLASCNKKPEKADASAQAAPTADNTFVMKQVNYAAPKYRSADLAMQELGGRVKTMDYTAVACTISGDTVFFDNPGEGESIHFEFGENGQMTRGFMFEGEEKGPELKRNSKGQIERTERLLPEMNYTYVNSFVYNDASNIASEEVQGLNFGGKTINHYNDGVLTSADAEQHGEGIAYTTHSTFKVVDVDNQGNWIKRLCISETKSNTGEVTNESGIELRKIVYY